MLKFPKLKQILSSILVGTTILATIPSMTSVYAETYEGKKYSSDELGVLRPTADGGVSMAFDDKVHTSNIIYQTCGYTLTIASATDPNVHYTVTSTFKQELGMKNKIIQIMSNKNTKHI